MRRYRILLLAFCAGLAGCAHKAPMQATTTSYDWSSAQKRIVLVTPDIQLGEMTTGGLVEPRADWSAAAAKSVASDVGNLLAPRGVDVVKLDTLSTPHEVQLADLHAVVGGEILLHRLGVAKLPTKGSALDWTLGPGTNDMRTHYGSDYAMFIYVRDSYTTAGRVAVVLGAAMLGISVQGGSNTSFASIVDLRTGNIVWFNLISSRSTDLRNEKGSAAFTAALLKGSPL